MEQLEFHKGNESALMEKKGNKQLHKGSLYHCLDTKNTFFAISGNMLDRYSSAVGWQSTSQGEVFNDYENNYAEGQFSHAEGSQTIASGKINESGEVIETAPSNSCTHAEGYRTSAFGNCSHSEGIGTLAEGLYSHAENNRT